MTLKAAILHLGASLITTRDKGLTTHENHWLMRCVPSTNYNQLNMVKHLNQIHKKLTNADVYHKLFIKQSDELNNATEGGEIGEDGKPSLRGLNYNVVCASNAKTMQ